MINGGHLVLYSRDAERDRQFLAEVLGGPSVDAGGGWLIVRLPPSEVAVHPSDGPPAQEFYLMCDDLDAAMDQMTTAGATCTEVTRARWGTSTRVRLPGGGEIGLYAPSHPVAIAPDA